MVKYIEVKQIFDSVVDNIQHNPEAIKNVLNTGARVYRYSFDEQILISQYRPDATACATFEQWNKYMKCYIKKGSKGIPLLQNNGKIKYVFDEKDTVPISPDGKKPHLWEFDSKAEKEIVKELENTYGDISTGNFNFEDKILKLCDNVASEIVTGCIDEIKKYLFENFYVEKEMVKKVIVSVMTYSILKRCNVDTSFLERTKAIDFSDLAKISKDAMVAICDTATSQSCEILRAIGKIIIESERNKENERRISRRRGLLNSKYKGNHTNGINHEMGKKIYRLHGGESFKHLRSLENERNSLGESYSSAEASRGNGTENARKIDTRISDNGNTEERESVGMGSTYEASTVGDRANDNDRNNLLLNDELSEIKTKNFTITDEHLGEGSPKEKFKKNIEALKVLKELEKENLNASEQQRKILSQYVGWGGLSDAFSDKEIWKGESNELREILTEEEYLAARASTLNAHYTEPGIISCIYEKLMEMGFTQGKILEPACGVGNFFGKIPSELKNNVSLTGVELDFLSGRIAKQLYPDADIQIIGFEKNKFPDNSFDIAIGNVPFGEYKLSDKRYDKDNLLIHDYFFVKSLDKVKPNGVIAFITTKGTLDKSNNHARELIAQKASLLGAIRLPNTAFKKNAGTEVTTDIIFLQKRETTLLEHNESWVNIGQSENGIVMNQYFIENPSQICGTMGLKMGRFGYETTCIPDETRTLAEQIQLAMKNINGTIFIDTVQQELEDVIVPSVNASEYHNFSYFVHNEEIYFKETDDEAILQNVNTKQKERIKGLCELHDITYELLDMQKDVATTEKQISEKQTILLRKYESFVNENGRINSRANSNAFSNDDSYFLLTALEKLDDSGEFVGLADIFSKRTVEPIVEVNHADSPHDALIISLNHSAKIDMEYMAQLCGLTQEEVRETLINDNEIFLNPISLAYETADEYLSGNVRQKLKIAQEASQDNSEFYKNVEELKRVQPIDLKAEDIAVRLGSTWVGTEVVEDFLKEKFQIPERFFKFEIIGVDYDARTSKWNISGKHSFHNTYLDNVYGTSAKNALDILEQSLNLKSVKVFAKDENGNTYVDQKATAQALAKQDAINDSFDEWIFAEPERRERLVKKYNEQFNNIRTREYNGSILTFQGMNPQINLKSHQKDAIARQLFGGNTLLAHCVGSGKTFTMCAAGMEMKRIGLCKKPMYVVPKPLVGQWAKEFSTLYPTARILAVNARQFTSKNRKKIIARIATGNYDAIILSHEQFEKIPLSKDYLQKCIQKDIDETMAFLEQSKSDKSQKFSVKQAETTLKKLQKELEDLTDIPKDNVVTFEQLGVDHIFIDESHNYKNLPFRTKMQVAGINTSNNKQCKDMLYKCNYINEITNYKGITFATGTPVSNSMTELFTNMKYLQPDILREMECSHFDQWAANFGSTVTAMEFDVTGQSFHQKTRFSEFFNLPELMSVFKECADVKTSDMLNLDVPKKVNMHIIDIEPSDIQKTCINEISKRADLVHKNIVSPQEDNMLKITSDGRKVALDQRMLDVSLPENENSKINNCVNIAFKIYEKYNNIKATQMIFSDIGTPNTEGRFDAYKDIKNKLIEKGVPKEEIAIIHDYNNDTKKLTLQMQMREGKIRFLIGSTAKCGTGLNVQTRLKALHHLDVPWRPSDIEQREGRIIRQGNQNDEVDIFRYVTKNTFDTYSWQIIEQKQRFVGQIMTSRQPVRSIQDLDQQALQYAEVKALASGNPLIIEKSNLEKDVNKLKSAKATYLSSLYHIQDKIRKYIPREIEKTTTFLVKQKTDVRSLRAYESEHENFSMVVDKQIYSDKKSAGQALIDFVKCNVAQAGSVGITCGEYKGFSIIATHNFTMRVTNINLRGKCDHVVNLSNDSFGMIQRMDNVLAKINSEIVPNLSNKIQELNQELESAKIEANKPFSHVEELKEKIGKLREINEKLDVAAETALENDNEERTNEQMEQSSEIIKVEEEKSVQESVKRDTIHTDGRGNQFTNFRIKRYQGTNWCVRADMINGPKDCVVLFKQTREEIESFLKENHIEYMDSTLQGKIRSMKEEKFPSNQQKDLVGKAI